MKKIKGPIWHPVPPTHPPHQTLYCIKGNFINEILLKRNQTNKKNNQPKFYKRNLFKNEPAQKPHKHFEN